MALPHEVPGRIGWTGRPSHTGPGRTLGGPRARPGRSCPRPWHSVLGTWGPLRWGQPYFLPALSPGPCVTTTTQGAIRFPEAAWPPPPPLACPQPPEIAIEGPLCPRTSGASGRESRSVPGPSSDVCSQILKKGPFSPGPASRVPAHVTDQLLRLGEGAVATLGSSSDGQPAAGLATGRPVVGAPAGGGPEQWALWAGVLSQLPFSPRLGGPSGLAASVCPSVKWLGPLPCPLLPAGDWALLHVGSTLRGDMACGLRVQCGSPAVAGGSAGAQGSDTPARPGAVSARLMGTRPGFRGLSDAGAA